MRILFDTHVLLWFLEDSPLLTARAREVLSQPGNEFFFSSVSIEEIAIKHALKPDLMPCDPEEVRNDAVLSRLSELPFDSDAAVLVGRLPWVHRDPFDRMLIAQTASKDMKLLSHDDNVLRYGAMTLGF